MLPGSIARDIAYAMCMIWGSERRMVPVHGHCNPSSINWYLVEIIAVVCRCAGDGLMPINRGEVVKECRGGGGRTCKIPSVPYLRYLTNKISARRSQQQQQQQQHQLNSATIQLNATQPPHLNPPNTRARALHIINRTHIRIHLTHHLPIPCIIIINLILISAAMKRQQQQQQQTGEEEEFTSYYLQQATREFAEDLDRVRGADDFGKGGAHALAMLVASLRQGTSLFPPADQRRVLEAARTQEEEKEKKKKKKNEE
ncbi:hypothetical protein F4780DRAFT_759938 [Xylariomycetidae sp. FL0641]|nr:hypothetical protein F4780DRAFT_759938 [Xylariomycetidae sp. FL0641]